MRFQKTGSGLSVNLRSLAQTLNKCLNEWPNEWIRVKDRSIQCPAFKIGVPGCLSSTNQEKSGPGKAVQIPRAATNQRAEQGLHNLTKRVCQPCSLLTRLSHTYTTSHHWHDLQIQKTEEAGSATATTTWAGLSSLKIPTGEQRGKFYKINGSKAAISEASVWKGVQRKGVY